MDSSLLSELSRLFGVENPPYAAISALVDLEYPRDRIWVRADPVFLHADMTSLLLFDSQNFFITEDEVAALFSLLNPVLKPYDLCLQRGNALLRWYMELDPVKHDDRMSVVSFPTRDAASRDIQAFMPKGASGLGWVRLMNECQMVLHDCPVNRQREARGEAPINSLWFWGVGHLPDQVLCRFNRIMTNDINARGLAVWSGIECEELPENMQKILVEGDKADQVLIVVSQGDLSVSRAEGMDVWLREKEKLWFKPILSALKRRRIRQLTIITDGEQYLLKPYHLYRFWRQLG